MESVVAEGPPDMQPEPGKEPVHSLLPFQRSLLQEQLQEDGLTVLASGLGLVQAAAALLRLQAAARASAPTGDGGVLLIVGGQPWQRDALCRLLACADPGAPPPAEVTAEVPATERGSLYRSAACLFVTTRILVVDLLSGRLQPTEVVGLLVLNAHRWVGKNGGGWARLLQAGLTYTPF